MNRNDRLKVIILDIIEGEYTAQHQHIVTEPHPKLWSVLTKRSASIKEIKHKISREENGHALVSSYLQ